MRSCAIALGALLLALATVPACAPRPAPPSTPPAVPAPVEGAAGGAADEDPPAPEPLPVVDLAPLWETVARPGDGFAGLAVWPGAVRAWLVVAAAASHRLVLFDAESGELLREVGALGERAGSFREPVAVAVGGDLSFVVERGNARVQVLRLPGLATVGFLGDGELVRPAAVAVEPAGEGWTVWVGEEEVRGPGAGGGAEVTGGSDAPSGAAGPGSAAGPGGAAGPDGAAVGGGAVTGGAGAAVAGAPAPLGSRATVHRFEVAADGSLLAGRRIELGLGGSPGGRLVGLALAGGERLAGVDGEVSPDAGPVLVAVASGGGEVVAYASPAGLPGRPLEVVAGVVAAASALPCGAGGGWIVALEHGGLLAFSAQPPTAASSLAVDGVTSPVALAVAGRPLDEPAAGTLYVLTADSRVVALAGGELAALAPAICR